LDDEDGGPGNSALKGAGNQEAKVAPTCADVAALDKAVTGAFGQVLARVTEGGHDLCSRKAQEKCVELLFRAAMQALCSAKAGTEKAQRAAWTPHLWRRCRRLVFERATRLKRARYVALRAPIWDSVSDWLRLTTGGRSPPAGCAAIRGKSWSENESGYGKACGKNVGKEAVSCVGSEKETARVYAAYLSASAADPARPSALCFCGCMGLLRDLVHGRTKERRAACHGLIAGLSREVAEGARCLACSSGQGSAKATTGPPAQTPWPWAQPSVAPGAGAHVTRGCLCACAVLRALLATLSHLRAPTKPAGSAASLRPPHQKNPSTTLAHWTPEGPASEEGAASEGPTPEERAASEVVETASTKEVTAGGRAVRPRGGANAAARRAALAAAKEAAKDVVDGTRYALAIEARAAEARLFDPELKVGAATASAGDCWVGEGGVKRGEGPWCTRPRELRFCLVSIVASLGPRAFPSPAAHCPLRALALELLVHYATAGREGDFRFDEAGGIEAGREGRAALPPACGEAHVSISEELVAIEGLGWWGWTPGEPVCSLGLPPVATPVAALATPPIAAGAVGPGGPDGNPDGNLGGIPRDCSCQACAVLLKLLRSHPCAVRRQAAGLALLRLATQAKATQAADWHRVHTVFPAAMAPGTQPPDDTREALLHTFLERFGLGAAQRQELEEMGNTEEDYYACSYIKEALRRLQCPLAGHDAR